MTKHGLSPRNHRHRFYVVWLSMNNRCYNPRCRDFHKYGGAGIRVCNAWKNPVVFVNWCKSQNRHGNRIILDRRNSKLGYCPSNCRLVSDAISVRNRSISVWCTINGEQLVLKDAVEKYGQVSYGCAKIRVRERGWNPRKAVLTPYIPNRKTHCKNGHKFTFKNTYIWRGDRHCRRCRSESAKRHADSN